MTLTAQELSNIDCLAMAVVKSNVAHASEEILAAQYSLLRSALADYGSEYLDVLDKHDLPGQRVKGAILALHFIEAGGRTKSLPPHLPEDSCVIHPEKGSGRLIFNEYVDGERIITVDFDGDICWTDDQYLGWYPAPVPISPNWPEGSELFHATNREGHLLVNGQVENGLRVILVAYKNGKTLWTSVDELFYLMNEPALPLQYDMVPRFEAGK